MNAVFAQENQRCVGEALKSPTCEPPQGNIALQYVELQNNTNGIIELLGYLCSKLQPLVLPKPQPTGKDSPTNPKSDFANALEIENNKLVGIRTTLKTLLEDLDI